MSTNKQQFFFFDCVLPSPVCQVTCGDTSVDTQYADNSPGKAVKFEEEIHRKYDASIYFR